MYTLSWGAFGSRGSRRCCARRGPLVGTCCFSARLVEGQLSGVEVRWRLATKEDLCSGVSGKKKRPGTLCDYRYRHVLFYWKRGEVVFPESGAEGPCLVRPLGESEGGTLNI